MPRKAARSSQRAPQAGQRAAPSVVAAEAAAKGEEEESRLWQRNRLVLQEDKPAAERCLEQLAFRKVED
ncbi:U3 small nucleolar RNA-associated protein 18 homolog [Lemmus lemmus]